MPVLSAQSPQRFVTADWLVLAVYMALIVGIGVWAAWRGSRRADDSDDNEFFLAHRSMPAWAVALSLLATMLSAATFIGGPQLSYTGNLSYLTESIGAIIAIIIVAWLFIPRFYRLGVTSIYELVGFHFGSSARQACSAMFMIGRVFASGARLFMVAIPFALVAYGRSDTPELIASILIIAAVAAAYTMIGGIRAVIWTDALQAGVLLVALLAAVWAALDRIGLPNDALFTMLQHEPHNGGSKLTIFDTSLDFGRPFTIWAALTGWVLLSIAAFGTDQDMAQRLLTCRNAKRGAWSAIAGKVLGVPMIALFLLLGLLLYVMYQMPHVLTDPPAYTIDRSREVLIVFILHEMHPGLRGLMIAGLFAAAMSSLDSALNAMASTAITDFVRPRWKLTSRMYSILSRCAVLIWGTILAGFACLCVYWQSHSGQSLITFALNVMMFAYSGLLAVFVTAIFTRGRGNARSAIAALITGFVSVAVMQPIIWHLAMGEVDLPAWLKDIRQAVTAFSAPWQMTIATTFSLVVCLLGRRPSEKQPDRIQPGQV